MPVRLRLQRFGRRNHPFFRVVAADSRSPRDGRFLEVLGSYNPIPNPVTKNKDVILKADRIKYWMSVGAQPSSKVAWLCGKAGVLPELPRRIATTTSSAPKSKNEEGGAKATTKGTSPTAPPAAKPVTASSSGSGKPPTTPASNVKAASPAAKAS